MVPAALKCLHRQRLIAVIRATAPEAALGAALAVARGGIELLEVTFTVPDAVRVMKALKSQIGAYLGAGTVLTKEQARAACDAGATFLVAPNLSIEVAKVARAAGVMYCPGAYTTGEILAARDAGAHVIKVYPVGVAGGPDYIRVIRDPLPDVPMLAAGGTHLDNLVPFLEAGCVGVGLGAALADPALALAGDFQTIERRARVFLERATQAAPPPAQLLTK
ncbi:MAG: bifunctional 4-hydroxy-2-oxoglutarate aldolase/2-dehydro-3-deoxy-phosphogluconate aldolase [Candidatus Eiseniibacteriota bacterium]